MFAPRPYQQAAVDAGLTYLQDPKLKGKNGLIVAPTGSGKSLLIALLATRLDAPCVVFQPSKEILEQNLAKLAHYGYRAAVFSASMGRREIGTITLATIGTAINHPEAFADVPYVLVDECHAVNPKGGMYADFMEVVGSNVGGARILGLTATPYRLASNSFGAQLRFLTRTVPRVFNDVVHYTDIGVLMEDGYLCPPQYREVELLRREKLKLNSTGADFTDRSVQLEMLETGFVGRLQAEAERQFDEGRRNLLVFTRFVDESRRLAKVLPGTEVVTAETPDRERAAILDGFKRGQIRCVANVGIVSLGFDYPELEAVILARPSISLALYYQQVGRIIRPLYAPGVDLSTREGRILAIAASSKPIAHVVDMVGLVKQFGRVEDLALKPGGASGKQWAIYSGERPLTNCYFENTSAPQAPAQASLIGAPARRGGGLDKNARRRRFWAKRARAAR